MRRGEIADFKEWQSENEQWRQLSRYAGRQQKFDALTPEKQAKVEWFDGELDRREHRLNLVSHALDKAALVRDGLEDEDDETTEGGVASD